MALYYFVECWFKCTFQGVKVLATAIISSNQSNAFAKFDDHKFLHCASAFQAGGSSARSSQVKHFQFINIILVHHPKLVFHTISLFYCYGSIVLFVSAEFSVILLFYCFCLFLRCVYMHAHQYSILSKNTNDILSNDFQ